jgi:hypothetical protein
MSEDWTPATDNWRQEHEASGYRNPVSVADHVRLYAGEVVRHPRTGEIMPTRAVCSEDRFGLVEHTAVDRVGRTISEFSRDGSTRRWFDPWRGRAQVQQQTPHGQFPLNDAMSAQAKRASQIVTNAGEPYTETVYTAPGVVARVMQKVFGSK